MQGGNAAITCGMLSLFAGAASAANVVGTITADNYYGLYSVVNDNIAFVGGSELGPEGGNGGEYNWSIAETFTFNTDDVVYIATWSDDFYAQGLLAEFFIGGTEQAVRTGDPVWQVFNTGISKNDNSTYPTAAEIATQIGIANDTMAWTTPAVGDANTAGANPWGLIAGISSEANWTWARRGDGGNPFIPGQDLGEYLIFCATIPSPGASLLLAGSGLALMFRRNRK